MGSLTQSPRADVQGASGEPALAASPRLLGPDILRGFLLLWMMLTHMPTDASVIANQTFGFVSGAEGFIFLSAFMVSRLARHIEQKHGVAATFRDLVRRTFRVYAYHCVLLVIAFTGVAAVAVSFHRLSLENLLSYYLASPKQATIAAFLLAYRPSLFDILPMYVIFMALTPLVRETARRWSWKPVIGVSVAIWVAAQFGVRAWIHNHFHLFGIVVPQDSTGAFNLYGWQLLWTAGLALGSLSAHLPQGRSPLSAIGLRVPPRWLKWSIGVAIILLVLRYCPVYQWINPVLYGALIDKWRLGPARLIDFAALTAIVIRYGAKLRNIPFIRPLAVLGQASIEVFSVHILFCLGAHALSPDADPRFPWWEQIAMLTVTILGLFATAQLARKYGKRGKRRRAAAQIAASPRSVLRSIPGEAR
ncbi:MAG: OpgC domain-containing protein [Bryobacteraceae bacterium]